MSQPIENLDEVLKNNSLKTQPVRLLNFERFMLPPINTARDSEFARLIVIFTIFSSKY